MTQLTTFTEPTTKGTPMQKILVCNLQGYGFSILWTLDGVTWIRASRLRPFNAVERDRWLAKYCEEQPQAEVRTVEDFYCRIPADWAQKGTRIL